MRRPLLILLLGVLAVGAAFAQMEESLQSVYLKADLELVLPNLANRPRLIESYGRVGIQAIRGHEDGSLIKAYVSFFTAFKLGRQERERFLALQVIDSNGNVLVDSAMSPLNAREGSGEISEWVEISDQSGLAAIETILADPERTSLNLTGFTQPAGLLRGVLRSNEMTAIRENQQRIDAIYAIVREMALRMSIPVPR